MRITTETSVGIFVLTAAAIFCYMTFHIGVLRLDTMSHKKQYVYFDDVSGLSKKADVKIAGVTVGWIESLELVSGDTANGYNARAEIMVSKDFNLRTDAYAIVRQEGLLGGKYLEVVPGDPSAQLLQAGATLSKPGKAPVSIDDLLHQFKNIATNVEEITDGIKTSFTSADGKKRLNEIMDDFHTTAKHFASFSTVVDRILSTHEEDVDQIIIDVREFASQMRETIPMIKDDFHRLASKLYDDTLPSFDKNVQRIADVFDKDFGGIADKLESTADAIEEAALQTRDGFRTFGSVVTKIDDGKGLIGKLINEDQTYNDFKVAISGVKNYFAQSDSVGFVVDSHVETMYAPAENFELKDSKGYFDMRIHPNEDTFYIVQYMGSMKGTIERTVVDTVWKDAQGNVYDTEKLLARIDPAYEYSKLYLADTVETTKRTRDTYKLGFQFGKTFKDVALRFGVMEGSFGIGVDYDVPFGTDKMRWVSSFEAFDLRGRNRLDDQRPHLKWINRVFLLRNLYVNFGADDFISRNNVNAFVGLGLRFGDDDIKYFLTQLGSLGK